MRFENVATSAHHFKRIFLFKEAAQGVVIPRADSLEMWHESTTDLDFVYTDADCLPNELAELYSYSEMEDFAQNTQCWREYADRCALK